MADEQSLKMLQFTLGTILCPCVCYVMNSLCDVMAEFYVSQVLYVLRQLFSPIGTETLVHLYTVLKLVQWPLQTLLKLLKYVK